MRLPDGNNFQGVRLRSVDGTPFRIASDSIPEYLLHPVFLRFFACAILICALLDARPEAQGLQGWSLVLGWALVSGVALAWLALGAGIALRAIRRGWIAQLYTPVLLLPLALLAELALQLAAVALASADWKPLTLTLQHATRDLLVIALFDLLHGHVVVHAHPLARPDQPPERMAEPEGESVIPPPAAALPMTAPPPAAEDPAPETNVMVQIGPAAIPLASILLVRTEDHYLGVTTRTGKALHRAKMADIPELHSGLAGMQINRSVWVAYAAIQQVTDAENRQIVVTLTTGDEERVARPRTFAFRQSYGKYLATRGAA